MVQTRHNEYKLAALAAKKRGDKESAIIFMRIAKRLETLMVAAESGQPVDLASLPGPPGTTPPTLPAATSPAPAPPTQNTPVGKIFL